MTRWPLILGMLLPACLTTAVLGQEPEVVIRYPVLRPNGRLQTDGAFYQQDRNPLSNGAEARRARLAMGGDFSERLHFQLEIDFADDNSRVRDAWFSYDLSPYARLQAGQFKEFFTLEAVTSSLWLSFTERSLIDGAFVPPRHLGVGVRAHRGGFVGAIGFFANEIGSEFGPELLQSEPYGFTARGVAAPILQPRRLLHFGADARWRKPDFEDGDTLVVNFEAISETHVDRIELYDTGPIQVGSSYGQLGAELAFVFGSLSMQGEYVLTRVNRSFLPEPVFGGGYAFISFIPTGESRTYDDIDARFTGVSPARHPFGAIEMLLRYSRLDLNDDEVTGGAGHDWTIGLNWYPFRNVRMMANYVFTDHDIFADGDGEFLGDDDFGVFQFRLQYHF
jgi:phosphate-selective porin OprO and OprP